LSQDTAATIQLTTGMATSGVQRERSLGDIAQFALQP